VEGRLVFVIHNEEHRSIDYRWVISINGSVRYMGSLPLGPGQMDHVSPRIVVPCGVTGTAPPKTSATKRRRRRQRRALRSGSRRRASRRAHTHSQRSIRHSRARTFPRPHVAPVPPSQSGVQVTVSLQKPHESINYHVDCRG
jgi:hypothetical protein